MRYAYRVDENAEIAELQRKLRETMQSATKELDRLEQTAESIGRFKDLMIKQHVLVRRLERYIPVSPGSAGLHLVR